METPIVVTPIVIILVVLFAIVALLLTGLVLLQEDAGDGMGGMFGGSGSNQVGNRKGNILTRASGILGALLLLVAVGVALNYRLDPSYPKVPKTEASAVEAEIRAKMNAEELSAPPAKREWYNFEKPSPVIPAESVPADGSTTTDAEQPAADSTGN